MSTIQRAHEQTSPTFGTINTAGAEGAKDTQKNALNDKFISALEKASLNSVIKKISGHFKMEDVKASFKESDTLANKLSSPEGKEDLSKKSIAELKTLSEENLNNSNKLKKTIESMSGAELLANRDGLKEPLEKATEDNQKIKAAIDQALIDKGAKTPGDESQKAEALVNNSQSQVNVESARTDAYTRIVQEKRDTGLLPQN